MQLLTVHAGTQKTPRHLRCGRILEKSDKSVLELPQTKGSQSSSAFANCFPKAKKLQDSNVAKRHAFKDAAFLVWSLTLRLQSASKCQVTKSLPPFSPFLHYATYAALMPFIFLHGSLFFLFCFFFFSHSRTIYHWGRASEAYDLLQWDLELPRFSASQAPFRSSWKRNPLKQSLVQQQHFQSSTRQA